jgi:hypothetical protein
MNIHVYRSLYILEICKILGIQFIPVNSSTSSRVYIIPYVVTQLSITRHSLSQIISFKPLDPPTQ